ncbi:MAG: DUF4255 domain-containing protein [Roseiflexaceae bacterium]|nr:DUF4255 domain-containing protein [Roseiflexaceae bacterium]
MTSALAIAAVTAFLKSLLENGLVDEGVNASLGGDAVVSALPPDRITTGSDERPQLNLFLHQLTPHASLRSGERSGQRAMLGLDLHYLLTAYGAQDLQIEILLGYAALVLHRMPVVHRNVLRDALAMLASDEHGGLPPPTLQALAGFDPDTQIERLEIYPQYLSGEELSKIWSPLQARYRPSLAYRVSMVTIG